MLRSTALLLFVLAAVCLCGCEGVAHSQQEPPKWESCFWVWGQQSKTRNFSDVHPDVLYVHVGALNYGDLPDQLPDAKAYWVVFRHEEHGLPNEQLIPRLAQSLVRISTAAARRRIKVVGVQFDIDCPTGSLTQYAHFLKALKPALPRGYQVSITALLDWFRPGTAIGEVIKSVDEFVPQFYDLAPDRGTSDKGAIAAKIDAARWGPVFNRFGKRYRIGVSTFGRARYISAAGNQRSFYYRDLLPLELSPNKDLELKSSRSAAGETVVEYRAARKTKIGDTDLSAGDKIQFTLPARESVAEAVANARQFGGMNAGVLFFRWPSEDETLAMRPDAVLAAISGAALPKSAVRMVDGKCVAVSCVELFYETADPFSASAKKYVIRSSAELEYFLPEEKMPVKMTGLRQLELSLPPYGGRSRMYLGRAVTNRPSAFTLEESK